MLCGGCGGDDGGGQSGDGSDGRIAFFRASGNARYDLAVAGADGRDIRVLTGHSRPGAAVPALFTRPAWSPDGRKIAFSRAPSRDASGFRADIYVMDADGSDQRRITSLRSAYEPVWSPDGRRILFSRFRLTRHGVDGAIWEVAIRGGKVRQLTQSRKGRLDVAGTFSADGQTLLFTRRTCVSNRNAACVYKPATATTIAIYAARPDGSGARMLIRDGSEPALSPTGSKLAYASVRDRNGRFTYGEAESSVSELYVAKADGSGQRRLTHTPNLNEQSPSWRDRSRIAFQEGEEIDNAEGMRILEVNADGTCRRTILADPKLDTWYARPAWEPAKSGSAAPQTPC
jgi:Tol biopolymer transport system component